MGNKVAYVFWWQIVVQLPIYTALMLTHVNKLSKSEIMTSDIRESCANVAYFIDKASHQHVFLQNEQITALKASK